MSINPWLTPSRGRKIILRALIRASGSTWRETRSATSRKIYNVIFPGTRTPESATSHEYHIFLRDWEDAQRFPLSQRQVNYHLRQLRKDGYVDFIYRSRGYVGAGLVYRYPNYKLTRKGRRYCQKYQLFR